MSGAKLIAVSWDFLLWRNLSNIILEAKHASAKISHPVKEAGSDLRERVFSFSTAQTWPQRTDFAHETVTLSFPHLFIPACQNKYGAWQLSYTFFLYIPVFKCASSNFGLRQTEALCHVNLFSPKCHMH